MLCGIDLVVVAIVCRVGNFLCSRANFTLKEDSAGKSKVFKVVLGVGLGNVCVRVAISKPYKIFKYVFIHQSI